MSIVNDFIYVTPESQGLPSKKILEFIELINEYKINVHSFVIVRNGKILASNKTVWVLYLLPKNIENPEFIAKNLSELTGVDYESILDKAKKTGYKYQIVHNSLNDEVTKKIRKFIF